MKKITTIIIILISCINSAVNAQTYYPLKNIETNLAPVSNVNGQWVAVSPSNNTLGANYYQGLSFGFDVNNYASLVNGVGTQDLYFGRWQSEWKGWRKIVMQNEIGNVGIGTSAPTANLEVVAPLLDGSETLLKVRVSDAAQDYFRISNMTGGSGQFIPTLYGYHVSDNRPALYLTAAVESGNDIGIDPVMVFDSRLPLNAIATRPLFAWDSFGNRKMILTSNGNLGIGTTTTGPHKLAVEGSIGAREIKVQATGWSDFVFEKNYSLPTLEEVEKHINEKGHLKDVPSEKEVLENGINLGEMNSKLLQKIEELTLYSIEQNKKIIDLQKQNEKLLEIEKRLSKIETNSK
ncbi:hypothetical protein D0817_05130 [Flavobacterium cupreum]|uniref:Cell wall anchor protein n=2 Tax=Flavobacterium TaxID=237 RepID=A0A434AA99_9FLAO|nr:hypothetical protein [Flavobacterium cupreum]RUT71266.1 hypothetical protein D0817_05130 [Flavobacterium cupreum]